MKIINIPILFYVFAAISSPWVLSYIGGEITKQAEEIIYLSVAPILMLGLFPQLLSLPKINIKQNINKMKGPYLYLARIFMVAGIISVWINFIFQGGFPLISGNSVREIFTENILWNIFIFCSLGVFIEGYRLRYFEDNGINKKLLLVYVISAVLTGWKAALINIFMMYFMSRYPDKKITISKISQYGTILAASFLAINFMRAGGGDLGFVEIFLYIYWGFVNFSNLAFNLTSDCIYTNVFDNCKFYYDNNGLENPTWNVYTALTPIYIDGGGLYVFIYFMCASALFLVAGRISGSIGAAYTRYLLMYFIFIAHNGYYFNSKSGLVTIIIMLIIDAFAWYPSKKI